MNPQQQNFSLSQQHSNRKHTYHPKAFYSYFQNDSQDMKDMAFSSRLSPH